MFTFLLVVQALIAAVLVAVILMQQSEGGGLGMGGSPSGLMSARGAANFLTRATGILAFSFITLSILLAVVATQRGASSTIDTSLAKQAVPAAPQPTVPLSGTPGPTSSVPTGSVPVTPAANAPVVPLAAPTTAPRTTTQPQRRVVPAAERSAPPQVVPTQTAPATVPSTGNSN